MQEVILVHMKQACAVDAGSIGDAQIMKRLIEEGLPQANESIEEIRKRNLGEEEKKEDDKYRIEEVKHGSKVSQKPLIGMIYVVGETI